MATTSSISGGSHWLHDDHDVTEIGWLYPAISGALIALAGVAALAHPTMASIAAELFVGWVLILGGVFGLITLLRSRSTLDVLWSLITSLLAIVAGTLMLTRPIAGAIYLTLVLAIYFFAQGYTLIIAALDYRSQVPGGWGWLLFAGIVDVILGLAVVACFHNSASWALGVVAGVNLLTWGAALVSFALAVRAIHTDRKAA
jgi:uncharacterized membrane protein HdeD (DUF308 family)